MKRKLQALAIKQDPENPVPAEVLATEIESIAVSMRKLSGSKLKREAILTLVKDRTHVNKSTIERVLSELENLDTTWLKKK